MKKFPFNALTYGMIPLTLGGITACQHPNDSQKFNGTIKLDVRESVPDWGPYTSKQAPKGSPNILFVLYDDTGLASWSPFGGRINMPVLQMLADSGLMYSQFHTCALSSPTRSTLLTGRNHHLNATANIIEISTGFPGSNGVFPKECATLGQILQDNGWSTFWLGKDHNVPFQDITSGGSRRQWPLSLGFDRFYGFLGGETSQWYPDLVEDNHFIDPPYTPEEGYHLSKDLADHAISMIRDLKAGNPSKPWFMWFCPGANHAPHQCPEEYINKYKGKFDDGYEAYREWVLPRMIAKGIIPDSTGFTPFNPMPEEISNPGDYVRPWNSLNPDEKKLFSKLAEVYAGFSEYTDAQIGRIMEYLKKTGQYENTVIIYAADNGASGEGSPNGSVNENKFFNGYPDELAENLKYMDKLGGPDTYEHIPTGWAAAFSTPFKMFKRYSEYAGGTCDPLVISWPKGIKARGEVRNQYHHSVDIVPTILEICKLEMPGVYRGIKQYPLSGVSMLYTFEAKPDAPSQKHVQYYAMMGTRGIWKDGWKAAALHAPMSGKGHFDQDKWELYNVEEDRAESKNLAKEHPEKLRELIEAWNKEAEKNFVLPLDDRGIYEMAYIERPTGEPPRERFTYFPDTSPVPTGAAADVTGRSYKILSEVEITDPDCSGVIFAHGARFGGHSLFIRDKKLCYVYNFLGLQPEQIFVSPVLQPGKYILGMEFTREKAGQYYESIGTTKLYVNDRVVASGSMRTQAGTFTLGGEGLCVGYDSGDGVSREYKAPCRFRGGNISIVAVTVEKAQYLDLEQQLQAAFSRD